jgi:phosphatidylglycerophosphate synthase
MRRKKPFLYVKNGEVKINHSRSLLERIVDSPIGTTLRFILIIFLLYKASSAEIGKWTLMFLVGFWLTFEAFAHLVWNGLKELIEVVFARGETLDKQKSEIDHELERLKHRD